MRLPYLYLLYTVIFLLLSCQETTKNQSLNGSECDSISNFEFIDITGTRHIFEDIKVEYKLLVFYDPNSAQSHKLMVEMEESEELRSMIKQKKMVVIAICPMGDLSFWNTFKNSIPSLWINGFDIKGDSKKKSYFNIRAFPTLVLVGQDNQLLKKGTTYHDFISITNTYLSHLVK